MAEPQGGLLFGNVAVQLGFVTTDQIQKCARIQEQLLALGVRKPLGEVLRENGMITAEQVKAVCDYQDFRRERTADKQLGRVAMDNGFLTEPQLQEALRHQKEFFQNNQKTYPLGRILVDRGHLTDQQLKALLKLQQRLTSPVKAAPKTQAGVRECGNCFEIVPIRAEKCPKCGNFFGKLTLQAKCKVCGNHQSTAGEYCAKCGANLITGTVPDPESVRQCAKCGKIGAAYHDECLHCGRIWDATMKRERKQQEVAVKVALQGLWRWGVLAGFLVAVLIAVLNLDTIKGWFTKQALGEEKAAVKERSEAFMNALRFKDSDKALSFYAGKGPKEGLPGIYSALFKLDPEKVEMTEWSIANVEAAGDSGTAYVTVSFKALEVKSGEGSTEDQLMAIEKAIKGGGGNKRNITLKWSRKDGDWRLQP